MPEVPYSLSFLISYRGYGQTWEYERLSVNLLHLYSKPPTVQQLRRSNCSSNGTRAVLDLWWRHMLTVTCRAQWFLDPYYSSFLFFSTKGSFHIDNFFTVPFLVYSGLVITAFYFYMWFCSTKWVIKRPLVNFWTPSFQTSIRELLKNPKTRLWNTFALETNQCLSLLHQGYWLS